MNEADGAGEPVRPGPPEGPPEGPPPCGGGRVGESRRIPRDESQGLLPAGDGR